MSTDLSRHPCFDEAARGQFGRIHLPVAPRCNVRCNFCDRRFDCANESRPGVTSAVLSPTRALDYLKASVAADPRISVVGIAGPGDPFANADETMTTLRLVRERFPELILCVATNGLGVVPHVAELAELQVSHVTVTVNAVDPRIASDIYAWVRPEKQPLRGQAAGELVVERQRAAVRALKAHGLTVKINTIVVPRVNATHVSEIARTVAGWGVDVLNIIPLYPVAGTAFGEIPSPSDGAIAVLRHEAARHVPQMQHCTRCRADAVGLLGEEPTAEQAARLQDAAAGRLGESPRLAGVAVATREGMLVNQHLGEADELWIYGPGERGLELRERRATPPAGKGRQRWLELAAVIKDCGVLLASGAGETPRAVLAGRGIETQVTESLISEALEAIQAGRAPRAPARQFSCGAACSGTGGGCG